MSKYEVTFKRFYGVLNTRIVIADNEEHAIKQVNAGYNHTGIISIKERK